MVLNDKQIKAVVEGRPVDAYAGVTDTNIRWKDAVIPYVIDCSIGKRIVLCLSLID